jgi:DNA-binding SARP family transcriptional activator
LVGEPCAQGQGRKILRKILEPRRTPGRAHKYLLTRNGGYYLDNQADIWVDVHQFLAGCDEAKSAEEANRLRRAIAAYEAALQLYQGDFLQADGYEDWTTPHRERYRQIFLASSLRLADGYARVGQ